MERSQMAGILTRLVGALYRGGPVPAMEGGRLFHTICEERRRAGDLFWTEQRVREVAQELGYWPWSVNEIGAAASSEQRKDAEAGRVPVA